MSKNPQVPTSERGREFEAVQWGAVPIPKSKKLDEIEYKNKNPLIRFSKPYGFHDYNYLQMNAFCVISDSGTIAEEGSILNLPAVMIRQAHERPEGMDAGTLIMTGISKNRILDAVELTMQEHQNNHSQELSNPDYEIQYVSGKILKSVFSYTDYINRNVWKKGL